MENYKGLSRSKLRIVWISHGAQLDGAERCLVEACKALQQTTEIFLVCPAEGPLVATIRPYVADIIFVKQPWWVRDPVVRSMWSAFRTALKIPKRMITYLKIIIRMVRVLSIIKPDVVVTNTLVIPCGALAAKYLGIPHIWYAHEFVEEDHGLNWELGSRRSLTMVERLSTLVIANSEAVKDKLLKSIAKQKLVRIYCAIDIAAFNSIPASLKPPPLLQRGVSVVLVGRLSASKGQQDAVQALALLLHRDKLDVNLWLVGGDPFGYMFHLRQEAERLGVSDRINFIPFQSNPLQYVEQADIAIVCSRCEAFGRVTIEAAKLGKPLVVARSGAGPELITDRRNGFLYDPGNASDLAEKIKCLVNDTRLRESIGLNARDWALHTFNNANYARDLLDTFERALSIHQGKPNTRHIH